VSKARASLDRISSALPLVAVDDTDQRLMTFRVHELVSWHLSTVGRGVDTEDSLSCVRLLTEREDYAQAISVLLSLSRPEEMLRWLHEYGEIAADSGESRALTPAFESLPVPTLMSSANLVVLWARVALRTDAQTRLCEGESGPPLGVARTRLSFGQDGRCVEPRSPASH